MIYQDKPLTPQELHNLAMNIVGRQLQSELKWEFLLVNSDMKKNPQFVCIDRNRQKHFVIVRPVLKDNDPDAYDPIFMQIVHRKSMEHKGKTYWAGVGLTNLSSASLPVFKDQPYKVNFRGLLEIQ